eukprot:4900418-Alexandrium_andersonii.AAC.1
MSTSIIRGWARRRRRAGRGAHERSWTSSSSCASRSWNEVLPSCASARPRRARGRSPRRWNCCPDQACP